MHYSPVRIQRTAKCPVSKRSVHRLRPGSRRFVSPGHLPPDPRIRQGWLAPLGREQRHLGGAFGSPLRRRNWNLYFGLASSERWERRPQFCVTAGRVWRQPGDWSVAHSITTLWGEAWNSKFEVNYVNLNQDRQRWYSGTFSATEFAGKMGKGTPFELPELGVDLNGGAAPASI
ncbi:hypothetical protein VTK26DRAFT_4665 [Humicola hyalothermophila]